MGSLADFGDKSKDNIGDLSIFLGCYEGVVDRETDCTWADSNSDGKVDNEIDLAAFHQRGGHCWEVRSAREIRQRIVVLPNLEGHFKGSSSAAVSGRVVDVARRLFVQRASDFAAQQLDVRFADAVADTDHAIPVVVNGVLLT